MSRDRVASDASYVAGALPTGRLNGLGLVDLSFGASLRRDAPPTLCSMQGIDNT